MPHVPMPGEKPPPPYLEEVSEGVFAYVQLDGSWFLNNAGFIASPGGTYVIDSTGTERRARAFRAAVETASNAPIRVLVNTHSHGDHTFGNFVFAPDAAIVGHRLCREAVLAAKVEDARSRFPGVDFGNIEVAAPFLTFDDRMTLYCESLEVELSYVAPAHTTNDIVA